MGRSPAAKALGAEGTRGRANRADISIRQAGARAGVATHCPRPDRRRNGAQGLGPAASLAPASRLGRRAASVPSERPERTAQEGRHGPRRERDQKRMRPDRQSGSVVGRVGRGVAAERGAAGCGSLAVAFFVQTGVSTELDTRPWWDAARGRFNAAKWPACGSRPPPPARRRRLRPCAGRRKKIILSGRWWATLESNQARVASAELQSAAAPCSTSPTGGVIIRGFGGGQGPICAFLSPCAASGQGSFCDPFFRSSRCRNPSSPPG